MVGRWAYDAMYRWWAPWDSVGVRDDLRWLLDSGRFSPDASPCTVDLGCGTGANVVFLAERGCHATGVDFSPVALSKARSRAETAGVADRCRFVMSDLTADPDLEGPYDLVTDFGTLDDLRPAGRRAMADTIVRLTRPGSLVLLWCFYARRTDLPRISFHGPSKMAPALAPGEERRLFGEAFHVEPVHVGRDGTPIACFLLTRQPAPTAAEPAG